LNRRSDIPEACKGILVLILVLILVRILILILAQALALVLLSHAGHLGFELHQSPGLADTLVVGIHDTDCIYSPAAAAGCWSGHVGIATKFTLSAPRARLPLHVDR